MPSDKFSGTGDAHSMAVNLLSSDPNIPFMPYPIRTPIPVPNPFFGYMPIVPNPEFQSIPYLIPLSAMTPYPFPNSEMASFPLPVMSAEMPPSFYPGSFHLNTLHNGGNQLSYPFVGQVPVSFTPESTPPLSLLGLVYRIH
jgi:hypothetical protein